MEARIKRPAVGTALVLISGVCWASYVVVAKIGIEFGLNVVTLNTARLTIAALFIGLFLIAFRRSSFQVELPAFLAIMLIGAIDYGLGGILYISSLLYIDASLAFLLVYTYPAMVVLFAAFLGRERLTVRKVLAVILTFVGVAMVLEVGAAVEGDDWIGVAFVLVSALIFSIYLVICEGLMDRFSSSQLSFLSLAGGALAMMAFIPFSHMNFDLLASPNGLAIIAMISVVGTALALILFFMGVREVGASTAAIITTAEPVFVVLLAWLFLEELLSPVQLIGMSLLVVGVGLVQWGAPPLEPGP